MEGYLKRTSVPGQCRTLTRVGGRFATWVTSAGNNDGASEPLPRRGENHPRLLQAEEPELLRPVARRHAQGKGGEWFSLDVSTPRGLLSSLQSPVRWPAQLQYLPPELPYNPHSDSCKAWEINHRRTRKVEKQNLDETRKTSQRKCGFLSKFFINERNEKIWNNWGCKTCGGVDE